MGIRTVVMGMLLAAALLAASEAAAQGPARSTWGQVQNAWTGYNGAVSAYRGGRGNVGSVNAAYRDYQTRMHTYQGGGGARYWPGGSGW